MLKLHFEDQRQPAIWLSDERFTIGSDPKNNLRLKESGVATFHAEIRRENGQYYLDDAGSNGTFVNGERIVSRYQLRPDDKIKVANVVLVLDSPQTAKIAGTDSCEWSIQAISGELKGQKFPIFGSMTLGRSSSCEICIHDDRISRRHSELHVINNSLHIKDLGSANGTKVNRKKIKEISLSSGDQIQFENLTFLVIGPIHVATQDAPDEEDITVFSISPAKLANKTSAATPPSTPQAPSIKIDPHTHHQVSMSAAGLEENSNGATPQSTVSIKTASLLAIVILITVAIAYWVL
ncbi:MAG: FHA domain-containing protein [Pseudomonadales bacterium]|nr:FHA domain-containing protein [Pseudomonadales bacterium]